MAADGTYQQTLHMPTARQLANTLTSGPARLAAAARAQALLAQPETLDKLMVGVPRNP